MRSTKLEIEDLPSASRRPPRDCWEEMCHGRVLLFLCEWWVCALT